MERATPPQMRQILVVVEEFKRAGVKFVPMLVMDDADGAALVDEAQRRLDLISGLCEASSLELPNG